MDDRQVIVLYGNTLLIDGVEACLAGKHELDVVRINATLANVGQHLLSLTPDLVIFDIDTPVSELSRMIVPLLQRQPGISFIGMGGEHRELITLCSQPYMAFSTKDLVDVIQTQTASYPVRGADTHLGSAFQQLRSLTQSI